MNVTIERTRLELADPEPMRNDQPLLVNAFVMFSPTLLGAAGERLRTDGFLKSNTRKTGSHWLF